LLEKKKERPGKRKMIQILKVSWS